MTSWEFPATEPIDLQVKLTAGSVAITAEPTEVITVSAVRVRRLGRDADDLADDLRVEYVDGRLEIADERHLGLGINSSGIDLVVTIPALSRCMVRAASADVSCHGELGSLDAKTASGEIRAGVVHGPVKLNTVSGKVSLDDAAGDVSAHSASGQIELRRAGGDISATTASGGILIGTAEASVTARTASGKVRIASMARGDGELNSVSGDIKVSVVPGTGVYLDLSSMSGRVRSDLDQSEQQDGEASLRLHCRTVSGAVRVFRATGAE